jgi:hypothetical protein
MSCSHVRLPFPCSQLAGTALSSSCPPSSQNGTTAGPPGQKIGRSTFISGRTQTRHDSARTRATRRGSSSGSSSNFTTTCQTRPCSCIQSEQIDGCLGCSLVNRLGICCFSDTAKEILYLAQACGFPSWLVTVETFWVILRAISCNRSGQIRLR